MRQGQYPPALHCQVDRPPQQGRCRVGAQSHDQAHRQRAGRRRQRRAAALRRRDPHRPRLARAAVPAPPSGAAPTSRMAISAAGPGRNAGDGRRWAGFAPPAAAGQRLSRGRTCGCAIADHSPSTAREDMFLFCSLQGAKSSGHEKAPRQARRGASLLTLRSPAAGLASTALDVAGDGRLLVGRQPAVEYAADGATEDRRHPEQP